jgi:hypothetical protein
VVISDFNRLSEGRKVVYTLVPAEGAPLLGATARSAGQSSEGFDIPSSTNSRLATTNAGSESERSGYITRLANIVSRESPPSNAPPPSVEQILTHFAQAKGEMAGGEKTQTLTLKGTFTSRDGLGPFGAEAYVKGPDKWLILLKDANGPVFRRGFDGSAAWEVSKFGPPEVDPAVALFARFLILVHRGDPLTPWLSQMRFKGKEPIGGGQAYVVEVVSLRPPPQLWFDTSTGLLLRIEYRAGSAVLQLDWADYRDIGGLMVPFKWREAGTENWVIECSEVKRNDPIDDAIFARPAGR